VKTYNPENPAHRCNLAMALLAKLTECGFLPESREGTNEAVYSRAVNEGVRVLVYTSVIPAGTSFQVRKEGKDAIRVCAVYTAKDGRERGIARAEKRVNRTGTVDGVVDRTHERMRDVYRLALRPCTCDTCGAPKFTAKSGNEVCADLCWLSDEERNRPAPPKRQRRRRRQWRRRY